ncbi:uncharacterized protein LOC105699026 [Orussus abietinus]|uniref:uncharacterized protein LOC105699026 n=1 Tax=Orussus abietinus TaxID=222816 RepID=UPI000C7160D6|nr:uncharacterized protein LOC105699026 [Orussus abietinus]
MKLLLALVAALAVTQTSFSYKIQDTSRSLEDDFLDFIALIPQDKVIEIVHDYAANDAEFQATIKYLQSEEFKKLILAVDALPEYIDFLNYLHFAGIDVYTGINQIHEILGLEGLKPPSGRKIQPRITGGLTGLLEDIKNVLPIQEIRALYQEKLKTSKAFAEFIKVIESPEFQKIVDALEANPEFQHIILTAEQHGIDVQAVADFLNTVFGLNFPDKSTRSIRASDLANDLQEFLDLIPIEEIVDVVLTYLSKDAQVQQAFEYLQSQEFHQLVRDIEATPETGELLEYLYHAGVNPYFWLNKVHEILGMEPINRPGNFKAPVRVAKISGGGFAGMIFDIKAIIPLAKLEALAKHKMQTSKAFAELIHTLSSPMFQRLVDTLMANKSFLHLLDEIEKFGIDLKGVADLLKTVLGINISRPKRSSSGPLAEDLKEFLDLVPSDKIFPLVIDYVVSDKEVQHTLLYLKSQEFKDLVVSISEIPEFVNFVHYLNNAGMDVYFWINRLYRYLGIEQIYPVNRNVVSSRQITGGFSGLLADVKALLPLDEIAALYDQKLKTSEAFVDLVEQMKSPDFQAIVDALLENEIFISLLVKAEEAGVDLVAVIDLLYTLFGITTN